MYPDELIRSLALTTRVCVTLVSGEVVVGTIVGTRWCSLKGSSLTVGYRVGNDSCRRVIDGSSIDTVVELPQHIPC